MAITHDNSDAIGIAFASSLTLPSFAVGAGSERFLLASAAMQQGGGGGVSTIIFNGSESFTKIANVVSGDVEGSIWRLLAPSNVTANIVLTPTVDARLSFGVTSLFGVNQTTPVGTEVVSTTTTQNAMVNVTTTIANSWIFSGCNVEGGTIVSAPGSGQTERYDAAGPGSPPGSRTASSGNTRQNLAINTYSMDHTLSGATADAVVLYALEVFQSGVAPVVDQTQIMMVN